jgi:SAM-dependent methyltransferase/acyl carrier protein
VAYVVHDPRVRGSGEVREQAEWQDQHVAQWQALYEETYGQGSASSDPAFDITGWNSSYTGQPIPEQEMREWVERTAERILSLRPKRVLEIGCGTGLLLSRIAPQCEGYLATDFSEVALRHVRERILAGREWGVELRSRMADDFSGIEPGGFDGVVLNSVVQYFPGVEYLLRVLEGAVRAVRPGGFVFVGDVRNLGLLETYHASVQLHQAPSSLAVAQLRERVRDHVSREEELVLDPGFFAALRTRLAGIREVQVQPKRGAYKNELNQFRYDAVLQVGGEAAGVEVPWVEWDQERPGVEAIRRLLETEPECLGFAGVVNGRVAGDVAAAQLLLRGDGEGSVGELREAVERSGSDAGVDPEELWALERELPYRVELSWLRSGEEGRYDVAFCRRGTAAESPVRVPGEEPRPRPWGHYASDPLRARSAEQLVPRLRRFLEEQLPDHMVPAAFVLLESLPLTPNGKVDRKALPAPGGARPELDGVYVAPRSPVEEALAGIWRDVLGLEQLGVHDDFFELGGHSLLATQVVSRLREVLKVDLPLRDLFEARTVARLAELVAASRQRDRRPAPPLQRVPRERELPLSFAQQRLWLLDQLQPGGTAYTMYRALRLDGPLELPVLQRSLEEIVRRHESARPSSWTARHPRQRIAEPFRSGCRWRTSALIPRRTERGPLRGHRRSPEATVSPTAALPNAAARLSATHVLVFRPPPHRLRWLVAGAAGPGAGRLSAAFLEGRPSPLPEISVSTRTSRRSATG